jgi:hypothetical protein
MNIGSGMWYLSKNVFFKSAAVTVSVRRPSIYEVNYRGKNQIHDHLHIGKGVQVGIVVVGLLLLNIKLDIGITEAITILSPTATAATLIAAAAAVITAAASVQHIAQVLVRECVTLTSPLGVRGRRLVSGRVEPLVDIVAGRRWIAEG